MIVNRLILAGLAVCAPLVNNQQRKGSFFYPKAEAIAPATSLPSHAQPPTPVQLLADAKGVLAKTIGVQVDQLQVTQHYVSKAGVQHVYATRLIDGIPVINQNAAIHTHNGEIIKIHTAFTASKMVKRGIPAAKTAKLTLEQAAKIAEKELGAPRDSIPAKLEYLQRSDGSISLVHTFQVKDMKNKNPKFFHVAVDAVSGEMLQVVNYIKKVGYRVLQLPKGVPTDGFSLIGNIADTLASPLGWHSDGNKTYTTTVGNNVDLHTEFVEPEPVPSDDPAPFNTPETSIPFSESTAAVPVPSDTDIPGSTATEAAAVDQLAPKIEYVDGGKDLNFESVWNPAEPASSSANRNASAINLFYLTNFMHDLSYHYGFTESAGNFQTNNFGKGGDQGDAVEVVNQSDEGFNNAYMSTPPDGQQPRIAMFIFDITTPTRDGSLDNSVPIHEFTHGISNRMTGGSRNGACLQTDEAGGMGEGWSDAMAIFLLRNAKSTRLEEATMGAYVVDAPAGIRSMPYSTNMTVNTWKYSDLKKLNEVHDIGEMWATFLNEMYWNLVDKHGYSANWMDATQSEGNIVALRLMLGGFTFQPCNPSMLQARNAILTADEQFYASKHKCEIWAAFAKRGMGVDAEDWALEYKNGYAVPLECTAPASDPKP